MKKKSPPHRRKIALIVAAVLILAGGTFIGWRMMKPAQETPTKPVINRPASDPNDYFPLTVGNEWRYKTTWQSETFTDLLIQIPHQETIDGEVVYSLNYLMEDGFAVKKESYGKTADSVLLYRLGDENTVPPQPLLQFPLQTGKTWHWEGIIANTKVSADIMVAGEESIKVPAGEFRAWKIKSEFKDAQGVPGPPTISWFAAGVGLLKQTGAIPVGNEKIDFSAELAEYHLN